MMRAIGNGTTQRARTTVTLVLLAIVMLAGGQDLVAQRPETTDPPEGGITSNQTEFVGSWRLLDRDKTFTRNGVRGFDEKTACMGLRDALGNPAQRCSLPFDQLKPQLLPRALAWLEFVDEYMSTKHYCMAPTVPVLLDMGTWTFLPLSGGKLQLEISTWTGPNVRDVWMDGRKHPSPLEAFYQGHSVGWFEDNELVVETANFTFDVDGLDDHNHIPSSQMKKVTERYKKLSPDKMLMTITHEDPLFLQAPFIWSQELTKAPRPAFAPMVCNRESAIREMRTIAPDKYEVK